MGVGSGTTSSLLGALSNRTSDVAPRSTSGSCKETDIGASRSSPPRLRLPNCIPIFSTFVPKLPLGITTA